jgi:hypothetical protein
MEVKKEYFEMKIKPILDAMIFHLVCEIPESAVLFSLIKRKLLYSTGYKRQRVIMRMA